MPYIMGGMMDCIREVTKLAHMDALIAGYRTALTVPHITGPSPSAGEWCRTWWPAGACGRWSCAASLTGPSKCPLVQPAPAPCRTQFATIKLLIAWSYFSSTLHCGVTSSSAADSGAATRPAKS